MSVVDNVVHHIMLRDNQYTENTIIIFKMMANLLESVRIKQNAKPEDLMWIDVLLTDTSEISLIFKCGENIHTLLVPLKILESTQEQILEYLNNNLINENVTLDPSNETEEIYTPPIEESVQDRLLLYVNNHQITNKMVKH